MKRDVFWFKHDANARRDQKILTMRLIYGAEGYGWWWMLIELMREASDKELGGMADKDNKTLQHKKKSFLAAFAEVGNITRAAEIAGIDRKNHYLWMKDDPDYPDQFRQADQQACDRLEQEARRRAVYGIDKPVFYKGDECGVVREYSDTLLIFLLKGAMPEKYKDRQQTELTGKDGGPIASKIDLSGLTLEELRAIAKTDTGTEGSSGE